MSEMAKKARAAMKERAQRRAAPGKSDIDASGWREPTMQTTKKTGAQPITKRAFKRGGKVNLNAEGSEGVKHAGKKPRGKHDDVAMDKKLIRSMVSDKAMKKAGGGQTVNRAGKGDYAGNYPADLSNADLAKVLAAKAASEAKEKAFEATQPHKRGGKAEHAKGCACKACGGAAMGKAAGGDVDDTPPDAMADQLPRYSEEAVNKAIKSSRQKIGKKEAAMIHAVLKGRTGRKEGGRIGKGGGGGFGIDNPFKGDAGTALDMGATFLSPAYAIARGKPPGMAGVVSGLMGKKAGGAAKGKANYEGGTRPTGGRIAKFGGGSLHGGGMGMPKMGGMAQHGMGGNPMTGGGGAAYNPGMHQPPAGFGGGMTSGNTGIVPPSYNPPMPPQNGMFGGIGSSIGGLNRPGGGYGANPGGPGMDYSGGHMGMGMGMGMGRGRGRGMDDRAYPGGVGPSYDSGGINPGGMYSNPPGYGAGFGRRDGDFGNQKPPVKGGEGNPYIPIGYDPSKGQPGGPSTGITDFGSTTVSAGTYPGGGVTPVQDYANPGPLPGGNGGINPGGMYSNPIGLKRGGRAGKAGGGSMMKSTEGGGKGGSGTFSKENFENVMSQMQAGLNSGMSDFELAARFPQMFMGGASGADAGAAPTGAKVRSGFGNNVAPYQTPPMARNSGGRTKGKTAINININTAPKPQMPMPMPPMPMPPMGAGGPPMGADGPPPMPMPPMGAGGPPPMPPMGAGGPPGMPPGAPPELAAMMGRKAGGRVYRSAKDMDAGAGGGLGRLEKAEIQKRKR